MDLEYTRDNYCHSNKSGVRPTFMEYTGGRKLTSTANALYMVVEKVHYAWKSDENPVASLLMLGVKRASDNISHPRLLYNSRKRRISTKATNWIAKSFSDRSTTIEMPEGESPTYSIASGILKVHPFTIISSTTLISTTSVELRFISRYTNSIDNVSVIMCEPTAQAKWGTLKKLHDEI